MKYPYYRLSNGELIPKRKVDWALDVLKKLADHGAILTDLTYEEILAKGDEFDAVKAFKEKHDCSVLEARNAIRFLRGTELTD